MGYALIDQGLANLPTDKPEVLASLLTACLVNMGTHCHEGEYEAFPELF